MKSHATWFLILAAVCVIGPYLLGVRPKSRRQWMWVVLTIAFLAWLLLLMIPLRSGSGAIGAGQARERISRQAARRGSKLTEALAVDDVRRDHGPRSNRRLAGPSRGSNRARTGT